MSKKMLKRSLVLGALMAFVITGSAWAAEAVQNNATGAHAIAIGENAVSNENCGVAVGYKAESAMSATAVGNEAKAASSASAYGTSANASGSGSVAIGNSSNATGTGGIAIGMSSTAEGGIAVGVYSDANNSASIAIGNSTVAGKAGVSGADATIAMGDRAESSYHGDIAIGFLAKADSTANGYSATAIGREAQALAKCATAVGKNAQALENRATALGHNAVANAVGDLALGAESVTRGVASVNNVIIGGKQYDFAGGDGNASNYIAAASFGGTTTSSAFGGGEKTIYRQLQNVAAGQVTADSTDAVNGSQLYAAYQAIDASQTSTNAAVAGINQRLDRTNAKINKVGAGAAALAALHPLDYDPDDKLTFSAGVGNYAGENAAALGAFYRPNEKFMVSLGGTMGNGENMVNLGLSIGLDKANGLAKLSKKELIQKVNDMEAEMAEMKAMLQELLNKK